MGQEAPPNGGIRVSATVAGGRFAGGIANGRRRNCSRARQRLSALFPRSSAMPIRAQAYRERYLHRCLSSRATFSAATITRVSFHRMHAIMRGEGIERRWLYCAILFVDQSWPLPSSEELQPEVQTGFNRPVAGDDVMRKKASNWGNREFAASMSPGANSSASRTTMSQRSPPSRNSTRMRLLFARRGARRRVRWPAR